MLTETLALETTGLILVAVGVTNIFASATVKVSLGNGMVEILGLRTSDLREAVVDDSFTLVAPVAKVLF